MMPLLEFYATRPAPCPYLQGRHERKILTELGGPAASVMYDRLARAGFRRSHNIAYRPQCDNCTACVAVRVVARAFRPTRSMRRVSARNRDLRVTVVPATPTVEQYDLFSLYVDARHGGGEMAAMGWPEYASMIEGSPIQTEVVEWRDADGMLCSALLLDTLADGLSAVYSWFHPDRARYSPGVHMVLWLIAHARARDLPFVYLGYWVEETRKMAYKSRFAPMQALGAGGWRPLERPGRPKDASDPASSPAIEDTPPHPLAR